MLGIQGFEELMSPAARVAGQEDPLAFGEGSIQESR
jgi:hypothetical protein